MFWLVKRLPIIGTIQLGQEVRATSFVRNKVICQYSQPMLAPALLLKPETVTFMMKQRCRANDRKHLEIITCMWLSSTTSQLHQPSMTPFYKNHASKIISVHGSIWRMLISSSAWSSQVEDVIYSSCSWTYVLQRITGIMWSGPTVKW